MASAGLVIFARNSITDDTPTHYGFLLQVPEVFKSSNNGFRTEWIHNALQAQYGQPLTLEELFEPILKSDNKTKRFFIEAGAHDGIGGSNTLRFELNPLWSGLLVEPNPKVTIYKGYKKIRLSRLWWRLSTTQGCWKV